jgi:rRNA maturation protein Nop10
MTQAPHQYDEDDEYGEDESDAQDDSDFHPEGPDPTEMDSSDDPDLDVCPRCRKLILEDAERCPHCGEYVTPGDAPLSRPAWVVIVVILVLAMAGLLWIF